MAWDKLADQKTIDATVKALEANGIAAVVVENGAEAKKKAMEIIPNGAEVFTVSSTTVNQIGLADELNESGNYNSIRKQFADKYKDAPRKWKVGIGASPDWVIGSVHAVTQDGKALIASQSGSQIPAYVSGAEHVLWIVSTKKIVKDMEQGIRRIYEYTLPLESERAMKAYGSASGVNKLLIINKETVKNRITLIFVKEALGF